MLLANPNAGALMVGVSDQQVSRFIEYMKQDKMINRWATPKGVKEAMDYALEPNRIALDGTYECDSLGCTNRIIGSAGSRCPSCGGAS